MSLARNLWAKKCELLRQMLGFKNQLPETYSQNKLEFNSIYPKIYLPSIKDGEYVLNRDEYANIGTHWIAWYVKKNEVCNCDCCGV